MDLAKILNCVFSHLTFDSHNFNPIDLNPIDLNPIDLNPTATTNPHFDADIFVMD